MDIINSLEHAFKLGRTSRIQGLATPYVGNTMEHSMHSKGWLVEDLRLALIKADSTYAKNQAAVEAYDARQTAGNGVSGPIGGESVPDKQANAENAIAPVEFKLRDWVRVTGSGLGWISRIEYDADGNPQFYNVTLDDKLESVYRAYPAELERANMQPQRVKPDKEFDPIGTQVNVVTQKHNHYYRTCPYDAIDVYRILDLFEVKDPCAQHAIKKLLALGNRGHKNASKDVQDVIDTMTRWQKNAG